MKPPGPQFNPYSQQVSIKTSSVGQQQSTSQVLQKHTVLLLPQKEIILKFDTLHHLDINSIAAMQRQHIQLILLVIICLFPR